MRSHSCARVLSGCFSGSTSCSPTPVSWGLVWFVLWVRFMRSHSCVLGSCVACFLDQSHAVPLLCPGFLSGLSCGSNSCGHTPVSWVLVRFVFRYKFMWSCSCVLASCLDCFLEQSYKVPLLSPGFYSGLSSGSTSRGFTAVSWVLVCCVVSVKFMRSYSCCWACYGLSSNSSTCASTPGCSGFLSVLS